MKGFLMLVAAAALCACSQVLETALVPVLIPLLNPAGLPCCAEQACSGN